MKVIKIKRGFLYSRVILPLWFLFMAFWTVFSPRQGAEVLEAYVKSNTESR